MVKTALTLLSLAAMLLSAQANEDRLRVRFTVGEAKPADEPGGEPRFPFRIEIVNTTSEPLTLAMQVEGAAGDSYEDHLRNRIIFETTPVLLEHPYQTMAREVFYAPSFKTLTHTLPPDRPLVLQFQHNARRFWDNERTSTREIPLPGLYQFRAHVPLCIQGDRETVRISNPQDVPVGGLRELPRNCRAKLLAFDAPSGVGEFLLSNPELGNRVGDRFHLAEHLLARFVFEITAVEKEKGRFLARLKETHGHGFGGSSVPLPRAGSFAEIESEFKKDAR